MAAVSDPCEGVRIALGAYLLEALDPAEAVEVRSHLAGCAACRDELALLAPLPGVLSRLGARGSLAMPAPAAPPPVPSAPPGLLERTVAEIGRRRRSLRLRLRIAAGFGALTLAGAGVAAGFLIAGHVNAPPPAQVAAVHASGTNPANGVRVTADVFREDWGSSIHLTVSGVKPGDDCQLWAVGRSGAQQELGSWRVGYEGWATVDGATDMPAAQISTLKVVTSSGSNLMTLALPSAASS